MIKKIVITGKSGSSSDFRINRLGYTIPIDGVWTDKWIVGTNVTTSNTTTYVCDEFTATSSPETSYSNGLSKLFTNSHDYVNYETPSREFTITIIFNQPIPAMKNIIHCYYTPNPNVSYVKGIKVYDQTDALIFSDDTKWTSRPNNTTEFNYLATPDLETTKVYPTNKLGTVETTDACHITDVYSIDVINPTDIVSDNTDIRYLLSFDGRQTYKTYDTTSGSWITVNTTDIMTQGLTSSELLALRSSEYLLAVDTNYRTLDILVGLITTDEIRTPCIKSIKVSYYKITT